jgi:hypothetical protein
VNRHESRMVHVHTVLCVFVMAIFGDVAIALL